MTQPLNSYVDNLMNFAGITTPAAPTSSYGAGEDPGHETAAAPPPGGQVTQNTSPETAQGDQDTSPTSTITPVTPTTKPGEQYNISLGTYWGSPDVKGIYSSLFKPIGEDVQAAGQGLQGATSDFLKEAGSRRTWDSIGGSGILDRVITGQAPTSEALELGRASYTGTGLAQDAMGKLTPKTRELGAWQDAYKDPYGMTEELLSTQTPTLTRGQLRAETGRLSGEGGYVKAQKAAQDEISKLLADYTRAQGEAAGIASQKSQDESNIATQAGGYLKKRAGDYTGNWSKAVEEASGRNKAAQDAWTKFQGTGSYSDLAQVSGDLSGLNTPTRQRYDQATQKRDWILSKYPDIKDVPLMQLGTSGAGHELLKFDDAWWAEHQGDHGEAEWKRIKQMARDRQRELDLAGFSGGRYGSQDRYPDVYTEAEDPMPGRYTSVTADPETGAQAGAYSELWNPYFDQGYALPDLREYAQFQAVDPTRENVATDQEIVEYNRIQDILDQLALAVPDYVENAEDWTAPKLTGDVASYTASEEAGSKAHKENLKSEQKAWQEEVQGTRKSKKKPKNLVDKAIDLVL
jgi:hypothetical protein